MFIWLYLNTFGLACVRVREKIIFFVFSVLCFNFHLFLPFLFYIIIFVFLSPNGLNSFIYRGFSVDKNG